jgi:hypothetical protein
MPKLKPTALSQSPDSPDKALLWLWAGVFLWVLPMLVISALVAHKPWDSTVTVFYHGAATHWSSRVNLYEGGHFCMNYLPHFAILFSAFQALPVPAGDILWRLCAAALLATGIWRFVKQMFPDAAPRLFFWSTLFVLPLSIAALRNGQSNAFLGGLMLHAAASIATEKWWSASGLIILSVVAKPVAIVLLLLAPVVYQKLRLPTLVALAALAVFPFLFARPDYVLAQYHSFLVNLQDCAVVTDYDYADITGILWAFGIQLSPLVSQIVRVSAGALTLALWCLGARRLHEPLRALWLLALASGYLMLFNPMNESNSYVVIAPVFAIWSLVFLNRPVPHRTGWIIIFMVLSMGLLPNIVRPLFGNKFALFYHPVMAALFLGLLISSIWRGKDLKNAPE